MPYTGEYRIEAIGAAGGYGEDSVIRNGGRGARMIGTVNLGKDEIIHILVGQQGERGDSYPKTSGGGGGTFVVRANNTPLIIAGGGGGIRKMSAQDLGCDASIYTTGNAGHKSPSGSGGSNGHGGNTTGEHSGKVENFYCINTEIYSFYCHPVKIAFTHGTHLQQSRTVKISK